MKQVLHILAKDLRRYAWAWISLSVIALIEVYLEGSTAGLMESDFNDSISMISSFAGGLLLFVLIVMVVQEESLVDPNADWLSRPIHRGSLLISKLAFILIITLLFRLSDCVVLILNQGVSRIPYALLDTLPIVVIWFAQVFLAAQTRSLPRYLLFAVAIYIGLFVLSACSMFVAFELFDSLTEMGQLPAGIADHHLAWIQTLYWLGAGGGILYFLYLKRKLLASWGLLLVAGFFALILTPKGGEGGMFGSFVSYSNEGVVTLEEVEIGGSMQMNGVNYLELIGVFLIEDVAEDVDLWTSIQGLDVMRDGEEIELHPQEVSQRMDKRSDTLYAAPLGYAHEGELRESQDPLSIDFMQNLAMSTQQKVGVMNFKTGASHVSEGNRLAIRSFYRHENKISAQLGTSMPDFKLEPEVEVSPFEAFRGKFSFSLVDASGQWVDDFDLSSGFFFMGAGDSGSISVELAPEEVLDDYQITVHARRVVKSSSHFINRHDIIITE